MIKFIVFSILLGLLVSCQDSVTLGLGNNPEPVNNAPTNGTISIDEGATTSNLNINLTLSATGAAKMRFKENSGGVWTAWETYATSKVFTLTDADATYTIYVQYQNPYGLSTSEDITDTIELNRAGPSGASISIDGGTPSTNSLSVTLTIAGTDATEMKFSYDNVDWVSCGWTPFATSQAYSLQDADGSQTIYMKLRDALSVESSAVSDSIILDRAAPEPSPITIDQGDYTNSSSITITSNVSDAAQIGVDEDGGGYTWVAYSSTPYAHTLNDTSDGLKTINVKYRDDLGNETASAVSDTITLDRTPPASGSITIDEGTYSNNNTINLTLSASDTNPMEMAFNQDGGAWSSWYTYATATPFTISGSDASYSINVKYRDAAGNEATATPDTITLDLTAPTVSSSNPASGVTINPDDSIVLVFSESMDTASTISGTIVDSMVKDTHYTLSWGTNTVANDQLTIALTATPTNTWGYGTRTLEVTSCNDLAANPADAGQNTSYNVLMEIYVSMDTGDDSTGDGTSGNPYKTITNTIPKATPPAAKIYVQHGTYDVNGLTGIQMVEGVSLYGGYNGAWAVDSSTPTTISYDEVAGDDVTPLRAIEAGSSITTSTVIDGFTIADTTGSNGSSGIFCNGGAPTISNNNIDAGQGSTYSYGIYVTGASPVIRNNTITSSIGTMVYGIWNKSSSSPTIYENTFTNTGGTNYFGIKNEGSSPLIYGNTFTGSSPTMTSYGVYETSSSASKIFNNVMNIGSSAKTYGVRSNSSATLIKNNSIDAGTSTAETKVIYIESDGGCEIINNIIIAETLKCGISGTSLTVQNNNIFVASDSCTDYSGSNGNVNVDPVLNGTPGDLQLTGSSPVSVTQGGQDLTGETDFPVNGSNNEIDIQGTPRSAPWSMGAYEYD